jgi:hypothetical protein
MAAATAVTSQVTTTGVISRLTSRLTSHHTSHHRPVAMDTTAAAATATSENTRVGTAEAQTRRRSGISQWNWRS